MSLYGKSIIDLSSVYFFSIKNKVKPKMFQVKCADCGCDPQECKKSNSSTECPNCTWKECCCWNANH